jgi:ribonuclease HI
MPFKVRIAANREASIEEDVQAKEKVRIYTDGSAIEGKVGAAAVLIRPGKQLRILHKHLGLEKEHTVHEAELVGILLGMQLISTKKHGNTTFMLGVDNQAAIQAFHSDLRSPGHYLAREALEIAYRIQKCRKTPRYALTIRWTAGHEGIEGNKLVDREVKKATEGHSSDKKQLPAYLRKSILINPVAAKRVYHYELKREWIEGWRKSQRGKRVTQIDKTTPSNKFLKAISSSKLSRKVSSQIVQLRISHAPVNQYLKQIGKVDSARCPACRAEQETIEHFLLLCPSYAHEQWALERQAKKLCRHLTMETLLGKPEMAHPLANYIDAMHRFQTNGEQLHQ